MVQKKIRKFYGKRVTKIARMRRKKKREVSRNHKALRILKMIVRLMLKEWLDCIIVLQRG